MKPKSRKPHSSAAVELGSNAIPAPTGAGNTALVPKGTTDTPRGGPQSPPDARNSEGRGRGITDHPPRSGGLNEGANANGQRVQLPDAAPQRETAAPQVAQQDSNGTAKERRGRRYKTFESIRRGLASVANRVELGTLDVKQAAVAVQALNALLATVGAMQAVDLERRADQLERQAEEAATMPESEGDTFGHA